MLDAPWTYEAKEPPYPFDEPTGEWFIFDCHGGVVVTVNDERVARLIAAAPDIAERSRDFLTAVDALCDWLNNNDFSADHADQKPDDFNALCDAMDAFRSTLAKAEGGQS